MKLFSAKKDFIIPEGGINSVETVTLGGIDQTICIQAENKDNPVLLLIHGGPGMPFPGVGCRSRDYAIATATKELVRHFVLVFWDQRGTGKSYNKNIPKESMNVEQFISDAEELMDLLRSRFNREKLFLAGYSWGTVIGLSLAHRIPEKLHAYAGISQIINWVENDRLSREWALSEALKRKIKKAVKELEQLGEPPYVESVKQWGVLRSWLMRFKSMVYTDKTVKHPGMMSGLSILLRSPDYSTLDIFHTLYSGFVLTYTQQMIEDFARIDFMRTAPEIEIPVYFIHGRKDVHVSGKLAYDYLEQVDAKKGKHFFWVEKSSHMFHPDDAKQIENIFIENVRKEIAAPS